MAWPLAEKAPTVRNRCLSQICPSPHPRIIVGSHNTHRLQSPVLWQQPYLLLPSSPPLSPPSSLPPSSLFTPLPSATTRPLSSARASSDAVAGATPALRACASDTVRVCGCAAPAVRYTRRGTCRTGGNKKEARGGGVQRRTNRGRELRKWTRSTEKPNTKRP